MDNSRPDTPIAFKRECRKYLYYSSDVTARMKEIRRANIWISGKRSLDYKRIQTESREDRDARPSVHIEHRTELDRELRETEEKIIRIINAIGQIPNPCYRPIIWMLYVQGKRVAEVAELYDMSKDYLSQLVSAEIRKLFPSGEEIEEA